MKLEIPYGDTIETIDLADGNVEQVIIPNTVETADEAETLRSAIFNPLGSPGIEDFLKDRKNILLLVNDATRPTPTGAILEILSPLLRGRNFKILIATGSHRAPTEEEYDFIFGKLYAELKDRVHVHDAKKSPCYSLGKTRHGNDLMLNTLVREADAIIPIGSIEPHYFAG
ncbi:MAG: lactate racemase domain-containing protein, partial [Deltaproteobacteria bacterium]|nr:lactate racemase domain-containing protein [Deltaproteobacteria bacterium]